jgi:hypothetical protein
MSARGEFRATRTAGQSSTRPRSTTGRQPATTSRRKRSREKSRAAISVGAQDIGGLRAVRLRAHAGKAFGGFQHAAVLLAGQNRELLERGDHEVHEAQVTEPEELDYRLIGKRA